MVTTLVGGRRLGCALAPVVVIVGVVLVLVALPGRAAAHANLDISVPAPSSVLVEGPDTIILDFNEPVEASTASIQLFDGTGALLRTGEVLASAGDRSTIFADAPEIGDGTYAVVWRVTSIDSHVVDGAFSFQVGTASDVDTETLLDQVRQGAQADRAVDVVDGIARMLAFVGLVVVLGAGVFLLGTPGLLDAGTGRRRLLIAGWAMLAVGAVGTFAAQGAEVVAGGLGDLASPSAWGAVDGTRTGQALLVRIAAVLVLGALLLARSRRHAAWWKAATITAGVVTVVSFPAAGHPAAEEPELLWTAVDAVHLAAVVVWLGGLALLSTVGRRWLDLDDGAPVVRRFSTVATVAVPVIVLTGVAQTLQLSGGLDDLTASRWGKVLLVKVVVVVVLIALGGVSRWALRQAGPPAVRRTVATEAVLGVVVLGLAAALVSFPPQEAPQTRVFTTAIAQAGLIADVTLTPGGVGRNEIHVVVTPAGGSLQPVQDVSGRMRLPSRDIPAVPVEYVAIGTNHYTGTVTLPFDGEWVLELVVVPTPGTTLLLTTDVPIGS